MNKPSQFKHSFWLKQYIDLNTKFRIDSNNDSEKYLLKVMNTILEKTFQSIRKQGTIHKRFIEVK